MKEIIFKEGGWLLCFLVLPLLILFYRYFILRRYPAFIFSAYPKGPPNTKKYLNPLTVSLCLRLAAFACIILALSQPLSKEIVSRVEASPGIDIVLALDISGSMLIEDLKPNRLEALKDVLGNFIASRRNDHIGIVLYAGESISLCPLTRNSFVLLQKLNEMENQQLLDGTAIGLGLSSAVNVLRESKLKSKVIVLLTDGENNAGFIDPLTAASIAKKHGIKVYTIGIGSTGVAPLPLKDLNGKKIYQFVPVKLDEKMLRSIAVSTGGSYYRAQNKGALRAIYSQIDKLEPRKKRLTKEIQYKARYRIFVLAGLLFFALEQFFKYTVFKTFD